MRKKTAQTPVFHNYTNSDKELYFLNLILTRKKSITKEFLINVFTTQQSETDYIRDEDIEEIISKTVSEIITEIGDNYKNFLIFHYFGTEENLIKFIAEDVYVELVSDAINRNGKKAATALARKAAALVTNINKN